MGANVAVEVICSASISGIGHGSLEVQYSVAGIATHGSEPPDATSHGPEPCACDAAFHSCVVSHEEDIEKNVESSTIPKDTRKHRFSNSK
jgi:hypothetical protein